MATLTVRNLDDDLVKRLRIRAAEHGRSAEAEHREILRANLVGTEQRAALEQATSRLAEFRRRTTGHGSLPDPRRGWGQCAHTPGSLHHDDRRS